MALQTLMGMRALPCVLVLLSSLTSAASADDPSPAMTGVAHPSVEELAIPIDAQKPDAANAGARSPSPA